MTALIEKSKLVNLAMTSISAWSCKAQKSQTHQATISTFSEVFLQNHASPSRLLTTQNPKKAMIWLFNQAQSSAKPWYYESARPSVK
jgi:hypothetical protein